MAAPPNAAVAAAAVPSEDVLPGLDGLLADDEVYGCGLPGLSMGCGSSVITMPPL